MSLKDLSWESYEEIKQGFEEMMTPFHEKWDGSGHIKLSGHGAIYDEETSQMETFSRLIWGIGPFLVQNDDSFLQEQLVRGLAAGCDPVSEHYYGELTDYHQKFVEMAAISCGILLNKEKIWGAFSAQEQENVSRWLLQINRYKIPSNNWRFFRILVNLAMKSVSQDFSEEFMQQDFDLIDCCYRSGGWYFDGKESQVDYYVPWAFHFYGLVISRFLDDDKRVRVIRERAVLFAQDYQHWFDRKGGAIPFGRSLTYRFAQVAFWAALVFADCEALPWEVIKGLYARNMKDWMQQEIFTEQGILNVGYHYQSLNMAEGYNANGSPYWAFKSFLLLAVEPSHPFWIAEVEEVELTKSRIASGEMRALIEHTSGSGQVCYYPAGQFIESQSHTQAKYGKFVYSTVFGFSVPKGAYYYEEGAFDSTLAVSEDGFYFRSHGQDETFEILEERVIHFWSPMNDVRIKTTIVPWGSSHVRVHELETARELFVREGGFSNQLEESRSFSKELDAGVESPVGLSVARGIVGFDMAEVIRPEVNTNVFYPRTVLPVLKSRLGQGKHLLVSLLTGLSVENDKEKLPEIIVEAEQIKIEDKQRKVVIKLGVKIAY